MSDLTETEIALGSAPDEWALARVARSVAGVCERRGWDTETASELLAMLGVTDKDSIKRARAGLVHSREARKRAGYDRGPRASERVHRAFHLRERPMPSLVPEQPALCQAGHELVGANVITRPDKPNLECRTCRNARKRRYWARDARWELEGRNGSGS
ncbi:MAG TPA: hypothetical protein VH084_07510 [Mycobacterium sp.]|nr:hypothetical protein [Mycobacterium sp.]